MGMEKGSAWVQGQAWVMLTLLLLLLDMRTKAARVSPPGKPRLIGCQSPEKETFTCWWEPGPTGDLPTSYSLYYRKENSNTVFECPDYQSAGENSCFFDKSHTSIWVSYNITVVARNALGNTSSDSMDVDVIYIVKPPHPENVTVTLEYGDSLYLQVKWEPPQKVDTRSGWITLSYELHIKREKDEHWERHFAGQQKHFQIFSPHPGEVYQVKVRCRPDHGYWSEWSNLAYVEVPTYVPRERSVWILLAIFFIFIFFILTWILVLKKSSVKRFLLPPVPGPKIKDFDNHLLKKGRPEDIFSVLITPGFPPTLESEDLLVEYLELYESVAEEPLCAPVPTGKEQAKDQSSVPDTVSSHAHAGNTSASSYSEKPGVQSVDSEEIAGDPLVTAGLLDSNQAQRLNRLDRLGEKDDGSTASCQWSFVQGSPYHVPDVPAQGLPAASSQNESDEPTEFHLSHLPDSLESVPAHAQLSLGSICGAGYGEGMSTLVPLPTGYVEVQKVNQENRLIVTCKSEEDTADGLRPGPRGQDYSKVSELVSDHILLLEREPPAADPTYRVGRDCVQLQHPQGKPVFHPGPGGYVDTVALLSFS